MKKLAKNEKVCIGCRVCESVCAQVYFKCEQADKSAIRINTTDDGNSINVCNQCGTCADICPVLAIKQNANGVWQIDKSVCVGCLACVGFCPQAAMFKHDDYVEPFKCVACGLCAAKCPTQAIAISND